MVLAASLYQLETIKTAKRLGYRVITTDNVPNNPGHKLADKSYKISTTEKEAVLNIACQEKINGIIAACTDVAVPTAAYVAERLSLPGPPLETANIVIDKLAFREFLGNHRFPVPEFYPIIPDFSLDGLFQESNWIIKPDRSSGCKGIFILRSEEDFYQRLPETLSFSPMGRAVLERYIEGFQGTCEGILKNGELALTLVLDRQTAPFPYTATWGHHVPTKLAPHFKERLFSILKDIWRILRVTDGPFDCDFVVSNDEVYILELTPRIGGNSITKLLQRAIDFDIIEYSVKQVCGDQGILPDPIQTRPTAIVLLGVLENGHLIYDEKEAELLQKEDWIDSLSIDINIGDSVKPFIHGRNRNGEAIVFGKDRDDLDAKVIELKRRLSLKAV